MSNVSSAWATSSHLAANAHTRTTAVSWPLLVVSLCLTPWEIGGVDEHESRVGWVAA